MFEFVDTQLENIAPVLDQEHLAPFLARLLECLGRCAEQLTSLSEAETNQLDAGAIQALEQPGEGQNKHLFLAMLVRLNDLSNLCEQYPGFKEDCCETKDAYLREDWAALAAKQFSALFKRLMAC